jgi:succinate dehydrogenase flavin-adding protein (antitoxin of CptAB toxin-antitoxin module)
MIQYGYSHSAKLIYNLRYAGIADAAGLDYEKRLASLPRITIPSDFDILTMDMLAVNLSKAKQDQYNPVIIAGMERDYVEKLYGEDSDELKLIKIISRLDPLPNKTVDEKVIIKDSYGCSEVDFVLSCYINSFINQLVENDEYWLDKKLPEQRKNLVQLATEKQAEIKRSIVPITTDVRAFA